MPSNTAKLIVLILLACYSTGVGQQDSRFSNIQVNPTIFGIENNSGNEKDSPSTSPKLPTKSTSFLDRVNSKTYLPRAQKFVPVTPASVSPDLSYASNDDTEGDVETWNQLPISALNIDIRDTGGEVPPDRSNGFIRSYPRDWNLFVVCEKSYLWDAPNVRYQPLYFEDVALERYGHVVRCDGFQSVISAAHFFSSAALLPLHMLRDPIYSCDYPLGFCRPGNCTNLIYQRSFWGPLRR